MTEGSPPRSSLRAIDLLAIATVGPRSRPIRAALSIVGIALGIAAIAAVLGIARSSQSALLARIDRLGTNLLTVVHGEASDGSEAKLPTTSAATIARTDGVTHVAPTAELPSQRVYRSDRVPEYRTNGLDVRACDARLLAALDGRIAGGAFLNRATARYPTVVLGHDAARQLGIARPGATTRIWLGGHWFVVAAILGPVELAPEIDRSALVGFPIAERYFAYDGHPSPVYVRTDTPRTADVAALLARATNPMQPETVAVSRPSDALIARLEVADSTTSLLLALGVVAVLVGGIGIANVMVISVLERRSEIGLRRALGAARHHVATQFAVEALLLAGAGGTVGVGTGALATHVVARRHGWDTLIPAIALWPSLGAAIVIGVIAGLYPALRAARVSPAEALREG